MRFLIALFLTLFISQIVIKHMQILNSNSEEKIVCELQEGEEDDSEQESENEDAEEDKDENEKDRNKGFTLIPVIDSQSKLLESHFNQPSFASVYLNTPYPPPDMNC
jgi:hypothetical protein